MNRFFFIGFFLFFGLILTEAGYAVRSESCIKPLTSLPFPLSKTTKETIAPIFKPAPKITIMVDPGHGGKDKGTYSTKIPRYEEKQLTLTISRFLKTYLENIGYAVLLTRSSDIFIDKEKRAEIANNRNATVFVSIHFNSAQNRQAEGVEIFYYRADASNMRSNRSKMLADLVLKRMLLISEAPSRGVKHGSLAVVRLTQMPAILVECGFLTNANEVKKLKDPGYLKKLAWGIAQGIQDYCQSSAL